MNNPSSYLETLAREFSKLPGIGPKSALRLAFHVLSMPQNDVEILARSLLDVKTFIVQCPECGGISDQDLCPICSDPTREQGLICVVKDAKDILTIEAAGGVRGKYHVLQGLISPLDGIGPEELNLASLLERCQKEEVQEVVLALNPTVEGDATALYIAKILGPLGVLVTRIAHGLPVGADLEFADSATIARSLECRTRM